VQGLRTFLPRFGLEILACEIAKTGHIVALARKV
jgi:hypothetical protein